MTRTHGSSAPARTELPENHNAAAKQPALLAAQDTSPGRQSASGNAWVRELITAGGPEIPLYGSPDWHALPADSPVRVASCVRAAEAWRIDGEHLAERLAAEIDAARDAWRDEGWRQSAEWVRRSAGRPRYSQLAARRGEHERAEQARANERGLGLSDVA